MVHLSGIYYTYMNKFLTLLVSSFLLATSTTYGQSIEPFELAQKIFSKSKFTQLKKYSKGEYTGRPNGQDLPATSILHFMLLGQTSNKAVVCMTILDTTKKGLDTYLHFEKDSIWKLKAVRALAMTGILEEAKKELEKMTLKEVDQSIEKAKGKKGMFSSREDYYFELGNMSLILDLDANIIKHFLDHKTEFERLKDAALKELESKKSDDERSIQLVESLRGDYRKLFLSSVSYGGYELGENCLNFSIGGMIDNTVGYFYVKDKNDVPEMNDDRIIMIREIGDGWFIYKTT